MSSARAIVAGHGQFAAGLISAVEQISGRGSLLIGIAVTDLGLGDIEELLGETMNNAGVRVIFTDLQAGSCSMAARRLLRGRPDAVLICGSNLPMVLDFVFADSLDPAEAARHAAERGRSAIALHEGSS
jgi:N-acetylgalactosamine PTS system EIIA component